jgi:hypothetical protein
MTRAGRPAWRRAVAGAGGLLLAAGLAACGAPPHELDARAPRVLIVSLPGVAWEDVETGSLPQLAEFADTAAIADLATRIGRRDARGTDAYLTLGAGTRAVAPTAEAAVALDPGESYGGKPASEVIERRLGQPADGVAYVAIGGARDANERSAFGADVGLLGDRLAAAGVDRAVIANADADQGLRQDDPPPPSAYDRAAVTALMGSDGVVPGGTVDRDLLVGDPEAPLGRRLDRGRVLDAFDAAWDGGDRTVVLVEASDLVRAAEAAPEADEDRADAARRRALADADELLGDLLARVDTARDAVVVLSPVAPAGAPALGVVAVRAPGVDGGLLRSATTRRAGYVQLADVAPTVLSLVGEDAPDSMEGRSFALGAGRPTDRIDRLADATDAAAFRDATLPAVVTTIIVVLVVLTLATALRTRLGRPARRLVEAGLYAALGFVPATFLVGRVAVVRGNLATDGAAIALIAALFAAAAMVVERRRPGLGPIVAVGAIVGLLSLDVLVGAPLQLNTTFGYSVAVAGRFTGLGNLAFALYGSAAIVLAALVAEHGGRRGVRVAIGLLAAVVLIEGLPMLGADDGGVAAMVPAFGVTALILAGRRIGWREVVGLVAATALALVAFALVDGMRPAAEQTHLSRLADHALAGRWSAVGKNLGRRWQGGIGGAGGAVWAGATGLMAAALGYAALAATGRAGQPRAHGGLDRPTRAAAAGLAVLATIGLVANDASVAVPFVMLIVVAPVVLLRLLAAPEGERDAAPAPPPAPGSVPVPEGVGA